MEIKASDVKKLRNMTGVGMMDAKKALQETDGDIDKAVDELRKRGAAKAAKKSGRETAEGRVHTYTHSNGKIGVVVEVQCETDFVARNDAFIEFTNDLALHIAAINPLYLSREDVPEAVVRKEKEIITEQLAKEGKPSEMLKKIVEGKMDKYYEEVCLLEQPFVKDDDVTVEELVQKKVLSLGENIQVGRFMRIEIGQTQVPKAC